MLQTIEGKLVYVVEFDEIPELPITWNPDQPEEKDYAQALARAIRLRMITEPGKYGIQIVGEEVSQEVPTADISFIGVNFSYKEQEKKFAVYRIIEQ